MIKNSEKLLETLYQTHQNLCELMKTESEPKKLKEYESEMNKINNLCRSLVTYINYYKLRESKKEK